MPAAGSCVANVAVVSVDVSIVVEVQPDSFQRAACLAVDAGDRGAGREGTAVVGAAGVIRGDSRRGLVDGQDRRTIALPVVDTTAVVCRDRMVAGCQRANGRAGCHATRHGHRAKVVIAINLKLYYTLARYTTGAERIGLHPGVKMHGLAVRGRADVRSIGSRGVHGRERIRHALDAHVVEIKVGRVVVVYEIPLSRYLRRQSRCTSNAGTPRRAGCSH